MEEYRKEIQKYLMRARILGVVMLLAIIAEKIFFENKDTFFAGLLAGVAGGTLGGVLACCIKYSRALKNEKKLKEMYIQSTDERNIEIAKETAQTSSLITTYLIALAVIVTGAFSKTVSMTLAAVMVVDILITIGVSIYYNKKM